MKQRFLQKSKPVLVQFVFGIILGTIIVVNTAQTDHVLHDFYVKPTISECFPTNQNAFCTAMRDLHGVESNAQLELGDIYWNELVRQALFIGVILFIFRIGFSLMVHHMGGMRKIHPIDLYIAVLWGLTASLIFLGGTLDYAYYIIQDEPVPDQLGWLNYKGIFLYTQGLTGDPNVVDKTDLYLSIFAMFVIIGGLWFIAMLWWYVGRVKRLI